MRQVYWQRHLQVYAKSAWEARQMQRRRRWLLLCAILLVYVSSYYVLSRRGFARVDNVGLARSGGFYFFQPKDTASWRLANYGCVCLYYPLIKIDLMLGTGHVPASEPLWGLSK